MFPILLYTLGNILVHVSLPEVEKLAISGYGLFFLRDQFLCKISDIFKKGSDFKLETLAIVGPHF